jgi:calcineurin-like phosphoesterase family protein
MGLFLTSDHHFGHTNILTYAGRPYPDVDTMNEALVDLWNDTVSHGDDVWVLGDFALGRRSQTLPFVRRLHGHKHLLPGNHDSCWPGHRSHRRQAELYREVGFDTILADPTWLDVAGRDVTFSHFPYPGGPTERYDARYADWRPADKGGWLVHGHVHNTWRTWGRQINVGVDAWAGRPIPLDTVADYVRVDAVVSEPPLPWDAE